MKKTVRNFIIYFLLIFVAGCSGAKNEKETNVLSVWHWMSDREEAFNELATKYETETGQKVKFELFAPSESYTQRVKASAQTNTLPDVYGVLGEKRDFASFIKSGYIANLSEALNKDGWKDVLFAKALSVNEFLPDNEFGVPPGIYGVPLDTTTIQMVYNRNLYEKAGLDPNKPPVTWEDFIGHNTVLREAGIDGFVGGFGEIWMLDALASNFAMNIMGEEKFFDTYRGKVPYTDPDWIKVFSLFKQMADQKVMVEGAVTMVNKSAEQAFANERAAYAFNGSWCVNVYKGMNPKLQYSPILPPVVNSANPMRIWGGAGTSLMVNDKSPRKEVAIQFLKWLTAENQQAFLAEKTENLPSNKNSLSKISAVLAQFVDDMDNATHPNVYPIHELPPVSEAFSKGIQSILIGEKTPEEIAAEVQRIKLKEMAKKN